MALVENTAPAIEPVTRAEAALFMRYVGTLQNDVIDSLITAARKLVEQWTGRTLITTTYDFYTNQLCDEIQIPTGNVISISSITYEDLDDATQTLSSTLYELDNKSVINTVFRVPNQTYPEVLDKPNSVKITFTAGYGANTSDVPEALKTAIKMTIADIYTHREAQLPAPVHPNRTVEMLMNTEAKYQGW
jgi:uncharacterized phiE125 gp8 family phage protein